MFKNAPALLFTFIALLVVGVAAFGLSRQGGSDVHSASTSQTEDLKYVAAAGANITALDSYRYRTSLVVSGSDGPAFTMDLDITENRSEQFYGTGKVKGPRGELAYEFAGNGPDVYMKLGFSAWEKKTYADVGIDKRAATQSFDLASAPGSKVENLANVTENGVPLRHLRISIDPATISARLKEVYTADSPQRQATDRASYDRGVVEYFIRASDGMPVRSRSTIEYSYLGQKASVTTGVEYVDYKAAVKLPSDLPR